MSHGVIHNVGGDKFAHLGHFRSPDVLKKGHNQGVPPLSTVMPAPSGAPRRPLQLAGSAIETAGKRQVRRALKTGGQSALDVAAQRPVAAAKFEAKQTGVTGKQRREMVAAARLNPESRMMEHKTAQNNLATAVGSVRDARSSLRDAVQGRRTARRALNRGRF